MKTVLKNCVPNIFGMAEGAKKQSKLHTVDDESDREERMSMEVRDGPRTREWTQGKLKMKIPLQLACSPHGDRERHMLTAEEMKTKTTNQKLNRKPIEMAHAIGHNGTVATADVRRGKCANERAPIKQKVAGIVKYILLAWNMLLCCASVWGDESNVPMPMQQQQLCLCTRTKQFISFNSKMWAVNLNSLMAIVIYVSHLYHCS